MSVSEEYNKKKYNYFNDAIEKTEMNKEKAAKGTPREPVVKLAKMVTDRIGHKITTEDPEYFGIAALATDEMCEVALKMKVRKPRTFEEIQKLTKINSTHLHELLDQMAVNGLIEYNWENPQHEKQYVLPMFVPGIAEFTNMNIDEMDENPELGIFFENMSRLPIGPIAAMVPPGGAGIGMHVIPVEKAIDNENHSVNLEHISHWLDKYDGKYAKSPCSCRLSRQTFDEGCADDPMGWCVAMGDMADYVVETNKGGEYIDRDEAMHIFEEAEKNGFVHQITNIDGEDKIFAICNCNVNVCYALRTSQLFNTPNFSRSAYVAKTDPEKCVACGKCVEYCPAGAVKLGQKICTKDGEISYPKHELPDEIKWGEDKWTPDYRDVNRINCYDTGTAPCKTACPAHIAIQGYLKMASQGKYQEALALIKKDNPFPAVCGRVCNKRCEDACTRGTIDKAVSIDAVKKFIADRDINSETRYIPPVVAPTLRGKFDEKIAIIGAGPAGLSCAFYLAEKGYKPTVFEKNARPGGMLTYGIPSFKLEKDVIDAEIDVIKQMGVEIRCNTNVGEDITIQQLRDQGYKAFYIAIGCQGGRLADIPGEGADGVTTAVELLHSATENESIKLPGKTVIVGGGNVAIDAAKVALRCDSSEVSMFCLESRDIMPASKQEIFEAEDEGITINCSWGPKEVISENGKVKAIVFKKCVSVFDENKKFAPVYDENDIKTVECDNIVMSIGQSIEWEGLIDNTAVKLQRGNRVEADPLTYQTKEADIFVGGDVYTGPSFAIDAIAAGKEGAISIHRFVQPHSSLTIGRNRRDFIELDKDNLKIDSYDKSERQAEGMIDSDDARRSYRDLRKTLTEEQVKIETSRCLGCGASVVDENKCIGCALCTTKCEFDAIHMFREHPECTHMVKSEDKMKYILPYMLKREIKIKKAAKKK